MHVLQLILSSVDEHLGCFWFGAMQIKVAMNLLVHVCIFVLLL